MYPQTRMRRLRRFESLRLMVSETELNAKDFVLPLFVVSGKKIKKEVTSMPGVFQLSVDNLVRECEGIYKLGIPAVILFGIPSSKDKYATQSYSEKGVVQQAVRTIKKEVPELMVITDVCLCEYTSHGHCGVVIKKKDKSGFEIDNDGTLKILAKVALSHADAGADIIAPSGMMDGMVCTIRETLDKGGFTNTPIMSYSAKYASSFYGPFREAAESPPAFGDRKTYQMDSRNSNEALREVEQDLNEGADIVMVKPALGYQDIIYRVKERFGCPVACYNVSGEFAMIKSAAQKGWLDEKGVVMEMLTGFRRSGADIIITYWAKDAAQWMR